MTDFFVHDDSGRVLRCGSAPVEMVEIQAQKGETAREGSANDTTQWWNPATEQLEPRPAWPGTIDKTEVTANGTDTVTLTGLPVDTYVRIEGPVWSEGEISDGMLELTFDTAGEYTVRLESFPYLDQEYTIHAT